MTVALQSLLAQTGLALGPLRDVKTAAQAQTLLRKLGYEVPVSAFSSALTALATAAGELVDAVKIVANATDDAELATAIVTAFTNVVSLIDVLGDVRAEISASAPGIPDIERLPQRLTEFLLLEFLDRQKTALHAVLHLAGLVENEPAAPAGEPTRSVHWERLGWVMKEPRRLVNEVYHWESDFDAQLFLTRTEALLRAAAMPGGLYPQSATARAALGNTSTGLNEIRIPLLHNGFTPETYSQFGITLSPAEAQAGKGKGLALLPYIVGAAEFQFDVCDRGELVFESTADIRGVGLVLRPPLDVAGLLNLTAAFDASILIREKPSRAEELILIGSAGGSRLSLQGLSVKWFGGGPSDRLDVGFEGEIQAVRLVIAPGEGDGFLQKVLAGVHVEAEASIALGIALQSGFTFRGGARLALEIGTHLDLGPVHINALRFAVAPKDDQIAVDAGVVLKLDLGPLEAVIEDIGLRAVIRFRPGNLGAADLDIGFKPPTGVGLSLDAGGFKGGGFLRFDPERGEYVGALELDFRNLFSVKAIGIINTKLPDGTPGFSLLIIISAEFTPIQLSFGFTLNGVGGIIGLNRTISVSALADGIRTNAVKSILFPEDVVANVERIVADIKQFFPAREGHFVVGPMAKLAWGTPPIVNLELGLLLDLPDPMFAVVGVLKAFLPADAPVLRLQVNFLGVVDFERGYVFFRADLFDSRLLVYSITGSMAFLVSWGETRNLALSVGGFHPDFRDIPTIPALPDGFRSMARIGISLLSDDNPRIKIESYFAVTANTVQFGARAELYAAAAGFNIYGFVGYDVLFQFVPFSFVAKLAGGVALRRGTSVIAGISVSATLSGPTPWDARGEASLEFLFFEVSVGFHASWGDPAAAIEDALEDLLGLVVRELADTRNWRADLAPSHHLFVSLRKLDAPAGTEPLVVHPAGVLTFSQRSVPLEDFTIQKFGTKRPLAENQFKLSQANTNNAPIEADYQNVREQFAPANFLELTDAEKLSRASFADLPSGFTLTATGELSVAKPVTRPVDYELSYLHQKRLAPSGRVKLGALAYQRLVKASAVRQSSLSEQQNRVSLNAPKSVVMPAESFAIANIADLSAFTSADGSTSFATEAEAYQRQAELVRRNPGLAGKVQVVSRFELNEG